MRSAVACCAVASAWLACSVTIAPPGGACDDQHACVLGQHCAANVCVLDDGGGLPGDDGGGTDGGAGADGGPRVLWRQPWGFTNTSVYGGTLFFDAGNAVAATVSSGGVVRAVAIQDDAGAMPSATQGRLRGTVVLPQTPRLLDFSVFAHLGANGDTVSIVDLYFTVDGGIGCYTSDDTLTSGSAVLWGLASWDGGFVPGVPYVFEVGWRVGSFRQVLVNGQQVLLEQFASMPTQAWAPESLQLGIYSYEDPDAGTGWSVNLSDWLIADTPDGPLPP